MKNDKPELSPCPFCSGKAVFRIVGTEKDGRTLGFEFEIECDKCGANINKRGSVSISLANSGELVVLRDDREEVAEKWNRRGQ